MEPQRVIDLALCYDAVIFGGYVRDVVVCEGTEFSDIDILWPVRTHKLFDTFIRVISLDNRVTCSTPVQRYGQGTTCTKVLINGTILLDCVMFDGEFSEWIDDGNCDFTCNMFYMSRTVPLGIRYVPPEMKYDANPAKVCINLTKQKKFSTVPNSQRTDSYWVRTSYRALKLVQKGWTLQGDLMSAEVEDSVLDNRITTNCDIMDNIMNERALDILRPALSDKCVERVRRELYPSSESGCDESG